MHRLALAGLASVSLSMSSNAAADHTGPHDHGKKHHPKATSAAPVADERTSSTNADAERTEQPVQREAGPSERTR